jgi:leader peptidase (prepilin peptidase)/N-methyltransferase
VSEIFVFIIGSIVGSFLNVCIHRLPKGESVVTPGSNCPACKNAIPWYDNIPLFSYIALKGRCRFCGARISFSYPLAELLTAVIFLLLFMTFGLTAKFFAYSVLTAALIIATFIDFAIQEIPDEVVVFGFCAGLGFSFLYPSIFGEALRWKGVLASFLGAAAGGGSIFLVGKLGRFIFRREAMGFGDVTLMAMIGSFLGWRLAFLTFFIAPFFGSVVGIIQKLRYGHDVIPYGPYLSLAAVISIFFGDRILRALLQGAFF